jgi:hypothetical protein
MRVSFVALSLLGSLAQASDDGPTKVPLPRAADRTPPIFVKTDDKGDKIVIGFIGEDAKYLLTYDVAQKKETRSCMSSLEGKLVWLSGDGRQFAVRINVNEKSNFVYEIRKVSNCSVDARFRQPKLQYPELLPQVAFNTELNRAVLVEQKNPYSSGKAFYTDKKSLQKAEFADGYGRVHILRLSDGKAIKRFTTPSEETQLYSGGDGTKIMLMQLKEKVPLTVISIKDGREIKDKKRSELFYLQTGTADTSQFWVNFFTSPEFYPQSEEGIPDVDEEKEEITFHTKTGSRTIANFEPLLGSRFWTSARDGKDIVVGGTESKGYYVRIYSVR